MYVVSYAGDLTPLEAWKKLENDPKSVLVDCRTRAEWAAAALQSVQQQLV